MGLFDSVVANCPRCGGEVEFQSKLGPCNLNRYTLTDTPPLIACDLDGEIERCPDCGFIAKAVLIINPQMSVEWHDE